MWMTHPSIPGAKVPVASSTFALVWQPVGWVETTEPAGPAGSADDSYLVTRGELQAALAGVSSGSGSGSNSTVAGYVTTDGPTKTALAGAFGSKAAVEANAAALAGLPATYVQQPVGGTDGQALLRSGTGAVWGAPAAKPEVRAADGDSWAPTLTELSTTIATRAQVGLPSIYYAHILKVPDPVRAAYPALGRWRIYTSTDHSSGDGGIAMFYTDAVDPTEPATAWTFYRTPGGSATIFIDGAGKQTETPCVVWNPITSRFHMYYQRLSESTNNVQHTSVVTSADGVTGWSTPQIALTNPAGFAPWNHTGYAKVSRIDGLWVAYHLLGGGTNGNSSAWSFSYDGLRWIMDRRTWMRPKQFSDGVLGTTIGNLLRRGDRLYAYGRMATPSSGTAQAEVSKSFIAPMRQDLRGFAGRARSLTGSTPANFEALPDGRLVGVLRGSPAGASPPSSGDYFRLAVLA